MVQDNLSTTSQIGLAEIACLLGSRVDIGSVCTSENINMWSKFKPIRSMTFGFDNFEEFAAECKKHNYGLKAPWKGNPQAVIDSWDGELNGWEYDRPTEKSLHRLTDFMRYNHKAVPPIGGAYCTEYANINGSGSPGLDENGDPLPGGAEIKVGFSSELGDDEKSLMKIGDIIDKDEVYFGVIGVIRNRPGYLIKSGSTPITEENSTADFSFRANSVATYQFYPVIFDTKQTGDAVTAGNICAVPCVKSLICTVSQGGNENVIGGGFRYDFAVSKNPRNDRRFDYDIRIWASKSQYTINNLYVKFKYRLNGDEKDQTFEGEFVKLLAERVAAPVYSGDGIPDEPNCARFTGTTTDLDPAIMSFNGKVYFTFYYGSDFFEEEYAPSVSLE